MQILDFFTPVSEELTADLAQFSIGQQMQINSGSMSELDVKEAQIALFDVKESRGASENIGSCVGANKVREQFYQLYSGNWTVSMVDLGTIEAGATLEDTYFAVKTVVAELVKQNCIPVLIGGSQDLLYAAYRAYDQLDQTVNLTVVDSKFDFGSEDDELTSTSYLSRIILEQPNNLYNFSNLGYQTYFNSQEHIDLIDQLQFEAYRLGDLKEIEKVEPILRDADLVGIDVGAIRASDFTAIEQPSPNGFFGDQMCAIARYAGISDKVTCFGLYEYNALFDKKNTNALLLAQIIWYFVEGFSFRAKDYPFCSKEDYIKYMVHLENEEQLNFYKSPKSSRWWMEVTTNPDTKYKRHALISCDYADYEEALNNKIPTRWMKAMEKLI